MKKTAIRPVYCPPRVLSTCITRVFLCRPENLKKGAVPVNSDEIVDLIQQSNYLGKIGIGTGHHRYCCLL